MKVGRTVYQTTGHYHKQLGEPLISGIPERAAFFIAAFQKVRTKAAITLSKRSASKGYDF
jgi:hypothetical protein